jgi:hypothetical protein
MGLNQRAFGKRIDVTRGTINAWEMGKTLIPLEQRKRLLDDVRRDAPRDAYDRFAIACGFAPSTPAARDPLALRAVVTTVVRAGADDLDVAASVVRKTLVAVSRHMSLEHVTWDEMQRVLAAPKASG